MRAGSAVRLFTAAALLALVGLLVVLGDVGARAAGYAPGAAGHPSGPVRIGTRSQPPTGSKVIGPVPAQTRLSLTVALEPRDPAGLADYATRVATPGSSVYRHYLTVAQFRQRFGPTAAQIGAVTSELRARGLQPGRVSANRLAIPISAEAGAVAHALSISLQRVRLSDGRVAYANTAAPAFPASVAASVQGVIGLDSLFRARPLGLHSSSVGRRGGAKPRVASAAGLSPSPCSAATSAGSTFHAWTANQLAAAYRFSSLYGAGDLGSGQTVALFELSTYNPSDVAAYQTCYGTSTSVTNMPPVDGGATTSSGAAEDVLDIEDVVGLSPQVAIRVYEGPNTSTGVYDTYSQIVSDNMAKVISTSWGLCEPSEGSSAAQAENTLFQEAATQGQSTFAAAGDSGSTDCTSGANKSNLTVDDPASQPFVTGVGGTSLSAVGPPPTETVWNDGKTGGAGGGGISSLWTMPSYQSGAASSLNVVNSNSSRTPCGAGAGSYCREVPDVSASADENHGYVVYYNGAWTAYGGTSAAAPLWAAFTALTNASSACGGTPIGFANPLLYSAAAAAYSSDFNDVTSGNNNLSGSGPYPAGSGYDMASGLGTPIGSGLPGGLCGIAGGPPAVTLTTPANGSATKNPEPSFAGAAGTATGDSQTVTVRIYSGSNTSGSVLQTLTTTRSGGSWSVAPSAALADGTYTARAQQTNTNTNLTGYSSANTFIVDTSPPTNVLSLTGKAGGGSYYSGSGTTVYYRGSTAGSFKLENAVSDPGSGPASSVFAGLAGTTTGWTFSPSTVTTPAGGPYVSNAFSWGAGTTGSPTETVTGTDNAGNASSPTKLSFINDSTAPTGSISAARNGSAVSVSFSAGDNSGSKVNSSSGRLERASARLSSGTCQTFGGFSNIGPAAVTSPYNDASVSSDNCYEYEYVVSDNVGNQATVGPSPAVRVSSSSGNTVTVKSPGNQTTLVGTAVSLQIHAGDSASGQALTYAATGLPAGLSIGGATGLISGTPTAGGTYEVVVKAKDSSGASGSTAFSWTITRSRPLVKLQVARKRLGTVRGHGLRVRLSSSQTGSGELRLLLPARVAKQLGLGNGKRAVVVATRFVRLRAAKPVRTRLLLRGRARRDLAQVRSVHLTVTAVVTGPGGRTTVSRRLLLR